MPFFLCSEHLSAQAILSKDVSERVCTTCFTELQSEGKVDASVGAPKKADRRKKPAAGDSGSESSHESSDRFGREKVFILFL